jgi:hypothetical protein
MLTPKTTAKVVAVLAVAVFGAFIIVGNQAALAQTAQTTNSQTQTANLNCSPDQDRGRDQNVNCTINQEMGNCQVTVAAEDSEVQSQFQSGDCS